MKVDFSETIQGISLKDIRRLFRKREYLNVLLIAQQLSIPKARAAKLLEDLLSQNYIARDRHDKSWFITTSLGKSLSASALVRLKNRRAHELFLNG